jgi:LDH2 family malate/lactate/ureidoglycolate dehydrogenase
MPTLTAAVLHDFSQRIFAAAGADPGPARVVSDHLIEANLAGHDSHGVLRIPSYVRSIQRGGIQPNARPEVVRETPVSALVDARRTFGHVSALFAADLAIAKAKAHGAAIVGTVHGNHIGRLGHYVTHAARRDVVLIVTTGWTGRSAAPFGGRQGALGTNPIAAGFPAAGDTPFLLDFATTAVAGGKVMVARAKHQPLPEGCLLDKDGAPTTDPNAYFDGGALVPFGGPVGMHKGYALSLLSALLSGALVQAPGEAGRGAGGSVFLLAIDAGVFGSVSAVKAVAGQVFERVKEVPPAPGFDEVLVPGEPEARAARGRRETGIAVPDDTWREITSLAAELRVAPIPEPS